MNVKVFVGKISSFPAKSELMNLQNAMFCSQKPSTQHSGVVGVEGHVINKSFQSDCRFHLPTPSMGLVYLPT